MLKCSTHEVDKPTHNATEYRLGTKKVHQFYLLKFSPYENPQLIAGIEKAKEKIIELGQEKLHIHQIKGRREDRSYAIRELKKREYYEYTGSFERERLVHLQLALDKLSFANSAYQGKPVNLCLSDGEFDKHKLQFRMRHMTKDVSEERKIFRDIKSSQRAALKTDEISESSNIKQLEERLCQLRFRSNSYGLEASAISDYHREIKELELVIAIKRENSIALAAVKGKIWNSLGSKEDLKNQAKIVSSQLEPYKYKRLQSKAIHSKNELELEAIEKDIESLTLKLLDICKKKDEAHERILKITTLLAEEKARYDQYVSILENARELAESKDIEALAELSRKEVENFMLQWNTSKEFRERYETRVSESLKSRELCSDGRTKNSSDEEVNVEVKPERRRIKWQKPIHLI